ncbi:MAG TPA: ribosome biogenesis GTPase Der [Geminicoccaceae bacterium]|nr:ribosome biogenesis GTPase Der [Geminicoccus sp.]HMU49553.1 ribosome biogenesis GTPase Der [Geminicoccaceae bacterium]
MTVTVAILGRPNVGKSTLFNRLVGARRALVDDEPGVTRDRIEGEGRLGELTFRVVDTAGIEDGGALQDRLRRLTLAALAEADLGLLVVDARTGITPADSEVAGLLRREGKPILVLANKCESERTVNQAEEAWTLGLGAPLAISAEHGNGMPDLLAALRPYVQAADESEGAGAEAEQPIRVTIVGRPNVGKSTLVNRLLGVERMLTGPEPGLTRDAVTAGIAWKGRRIELIDTAGLRRKARVEAGIERMSTASTLRAVRMAHVVVLLIDAAAPLEQQDLAILRQAVDEGRAIVIGVNKWDLVEDRRATLEELRQRIEAKLWQLKGIACVTLSALTGRQVDRLLPAVIEAHDRWAKRIPTAALNRWLAAAIERNPPPMVQGRRLKIRYATQARTRPPTFALFANKPGERMPDSYLRYLDAGLRKEFGLEGVPLRFFVRHGDNPFDQG